MKLNSTVIVNVQGTELALEELNLIVIDRSHAKLVTVSIHPLAKQIPLWRGPDYDKAGDYTQAQIEARISEILNFDNKLEENIQHLFQIEVL